MLRDWSAEVLQWLYAETCFYSSDNVWKMVYSDHQRLTQLRKQAANIVSARRAIDIHARADAYDNYRRTFCDLYKPFASGKMNWSWRTVLTSHCIADDANAVLRDAWMNHMRAVRSSSVLKRGYALTWNRLGLMKYIRQQREKWKALKPRRAQQRRRYASTRKSKQIRTSQCSPSMVSMLVLVNGPTPVVTWKARFSHYAPTVYARRNMIATFWLFFAKCLWFFQTLSKEDYGIRFATYCYAHATVECCAHGTPSYFWASVSIWSEYTFNSSRSDQMTRLFLSCLLFLFVTCISNVPMLVKQNGQWYSYKSQKLFGVCAAAPIVSVRRTYWCFIFFFLGSQ